MDKQINLGFHYFGYIVNKWRNSDRVTRKKQHLRASQPSVVLLPVSTGGAAVWNVTPCSKKICYPHHQVRMMLEAADSSKKLAILPGYVTLHHKIQQK